MPHHGVPHGTRGLHLNAIPPKPIEIARTLDREGQAEEALGAYRKALDLSPDDAVGWADYGGLLNELSHPEEALEACDKSLELSPGLPAATVNQAYALMKLGRPKEADWGPR